jgi:hypothetical protein
MPAMPDFRLVAPFEPTGDQPLAIDRLVDGLGRGLKHQTLLGATGTGKIPICRRSRPQADPRLATTRRWRLALRQFREFFPDNAVEYFVSTSTTTSGGIPAERHLHRRTSGTTRSTGSATPPPTPSSSAAT